jgi:hypothetical protein
VAKKQKRSVIHENVINLDTYRAQRNAEKLAPTVEDPTCRVAACGGCGHNQFLVCLENEVEKYDRNLVCAKCFEPAGEDAIDALGDILCGIDFDPEFDD